MPVTISARVKPELAERLRNRAVLEDRSVSEIATRAIEEYLRSAQFPGIIFVDTPRGKRKARLIAGPDVWEVVFIGRAYEMDVVRTAAHLCASEPSIRLALAYYVAYPEETDARLKYMEEFDASPHRFCPSIQIVQVRDEIDASAA